MIEKSDILPISFLKKSPFTGSFQGMRYRMEQVKADGGDCLRVILWEGPYSFDITSDEKKESQDFPFSDDGIEKAVEWLNETWEARQDRFRQAQEEW
ncbi:MAG: hypothetical protein HFI76_08040 [Lachnospiraceae bacterium]|nr:hypothetical protein [Lachnospiraceae bacterium]